MKSVVLLSSALLLAPVSAMAATDQDAADTTCVFVGMRMSQSPDPATRTVSVGTIMYFMGKLDGRSPKYELLPHLMEVQSHMSQDLLMSEAKRCEDEIAVRGAAINAAGRGLAGSAKPPAGTPPPPPVKTNPPATP